LKKNNLAIPFLILCFSICARSGFGEGLFLDVYRNDTSVFVMVKYQFELFQEIMEPIEAGLKSQITFTIQLFEKEEGFFSFLGDRFLNEKKPEFVGYKDFFENVFVIENERGEKLNFATKEEFLAAFLALNQFPLDDFMREKKSAQCYLRVQVQLYKVKLIVPLTLIYFFSMKGVFESEWKTIALP
jgi:hypothetical protein